MPNDMMLAALRKNRMSSYDEEGDDESDYHEGGESKGQDYDELCKRVDELEKIVMVLKKALNIPDEQEQEQGQVAIKEEGEESESPNLEKAYS